MTKSILSPNTALPAASRLSWWEFTLLGIRAKKVLFDTFSSLTPHLRFSSRRCWSASKTQPASPPTTGPLHLTTATASSGSLCSHTLRTRRRECQGRCTRAAQRKARGRSRRGRAEAEALARDARPSPAVALRQSGLSAATGHGPAVPAPSAAPQTWRAPPGVGRAAEPPPPSGLPRCPQSGPRNQQRRNTVFPWRRRAGGTPLRYFYFPPGRPSVISSG